MSRILIALTGPSGVGKGYLKECLKEEFDLTEPPVYTTRKKRRNENSSERIFLIQEDFQRRLKTGEFILVNKIYGNYYGFHKDAFSHSSNQITEIYVDNVNRFKKICPSALLIGLLPKSFNFLMYRLMKRKKESGEDISLRIESARAELDKIRKRKEFFDYIYYVGRNNEDRICKDVINYVKSYYYI